MSEFTSIAVRGSAQLNLSLALPTNRHIAIEQTISLVISAIIYKNVYLPVNVRLLLFYRCRSCVFNFRYIATKVFRSKMRTHFATRRFQSIDTRRERTLQKYLDTQITNIAMHLESRK